MTWVGRIARVTALIVSASLFAGSPASAKVFRWSAPTEVPELDPQARRVVFTRAFIASVMEPLTRYGKDLTIEPALAEKWELKAPDVWRFHLRRGVTFSNGNPFTADDVIATFERGMDAKSPARGVFAGVKSIAKVDDHTVDITTNGPYPILERDLTDVLIFDREWLVEHNALAPVDPTSGQESYAFRNAMGTGPFKVRKFDPDREIVLEENPRWWNQANKEHNLTEVIFRPIKAASTRVAALLSGEVDLILPLPLQDIDRVASTPGVKVIEGPDITTLYLGMRIGQDQLTTGEPNPFKDVRVRRAIYQALDVKLLVDRIMRGRGTEAAVLMSKFHRGYDPRFAERVAPYDVEGAKKLLAEAGYPKGFRASMVCPNDRYVNDQQLCLAIVSMLAKIGVTIDLQVVPSARWLPMTNNGDADMWLAGWTAVGTVDAHSYLHAIIHSKSNTKGAFNGGKYANPRVDELENKIAQETDMAERNKLLYEAFSLHRQDLAHLPLLQPTLVWGARSNVHVHQLPTSAFDLRWVKID